MPFTHIVQPDRRSFDITTVGLYAGQIRIEPIPCVGVGAFKMAQAAQLIFSNMPPSGFGSQSEQNIVVKRPYNRQQDPSGKPPFPHYVIADELIKLSREANVLYWAKSLLTMTYTFIDRIIDKSITAPDFPIPRLRFVNAGLALGYATTSGGGGP